MNTADVEALIRGGLPDAAVQIVDTTGTGDHFEAVIVSTAFADKSLVERHQLVYRALGVAMAGPIHALSLKTYTPQEWARTP